MYALFGQRSRPISLKEGPIKDIVIDREAPDINFMKLFEDITKYLKNKPGFDEFSDFVSDIIPILQMITKYTYEYPEGLPVDVKDKILARFLPIAKKYIPVIIKDKRRGKDCPNCKFYVEELTPNQDGMINCTQCDAVITSYNYRGFNHNYVTEHGISTTINEDKKQFEENMKELMGIQSVIIDLDDLFPKLDAYFQSKGMKTSDQIKKLPLINGVRGPYTIKNLHEGLEAAGYQRQYKNDIYIARIYWGWEPYDFSNMIPQLLADFDVVQPIYDSAIQKLGRKSKNKRVRLYYYLRCRNIPINLKMLKLVQVEETISDYDSLFSHVTREMRKLHSSWPFVTLPRT